MQNFRVVNNGDADRIQFGRSLNIEAAPTFVQVGDWVAGYEVVRVGPGKHDSQPATIITLADRQGAREVGRLVLLNDATDDAVLRIVRPVLDVVDEEAHRVLDAEQIQTYLVLVGTGRFAREKALQIARES